jgi:opacity protein-like surface antigen
MKSIVTILALVIMASPSFAATTAKKHTKTVTTTETTTSAANNSNTYTHATNNNAINWNAGVGLGTISSEFEFGVMANGMYPVSNLAEGDILVGGQTGFMYGPGTVSTWLIPIMAAGQFNFKGNGKITPYAGLSMGVSIVHLSTGSSATVNGVTIATASTSSTSTDFAIMAKGGLYFGEAQKYYAEIPLGAMGGAFAIFPSVGMKF